MQRKAQAQEPLKIIIGIVVLLALALVVYVAFIKPSASSASGLFKSLDSCYAPIVGAAGKCDCDVAPIGTCPLDTEAKINMNCPLAEKSCAGSAYTQMAIDAKAKYKARVKTIEDQIKPEKLSSDMDRAIQSEFFGQCCRGGKQ